MSTHTSPDHAVSAPHIDRGDFARRVVAWQMQHGRHDLPWQRARHAYAVWISEVMLQQTQVATVIPYYQRFMQRFPDISTLARATVDEVLQHWSGLGYYSRARNLHRAAVAIATEHEGRFPSDVPSIARLPGIGRSTAAAIAALAFGERCAILDGNVKRVLCRHFAVSGDPSASAVERSLWTIAEQLVPAAEAHIYTQGMMDLGATVCVRHRPACELCPLSSDCIAFRTGRVNELPNARKRLDRPERSVAMLLLRHGDRLLLEKRPAQGIWGGLWSLPEADIRADMRAESVRRFAVDVEAVSALPALNHGFTHFSLRIEPWQVRVSAVHTQAREPSISWLTVEQARDSALPAPIRKILSTHEG